jgi:hypothetical protein
MYSLLAREAFCATLSVPLGMTERHTRRYGSEDLEHAPGLYACGVYARPRACRSI